MTKKNKGDNMKEEMASDELKDMREAAGDVYPADPNETVQPFSFSDLDTDFSNIQRMTIVVRGKKRDIFVVVADALQKEQVNDARTTDNPSLIDYDDQLVDLVYMDEKEAAKANRVLLASLSEADKEEQTQMAMAQQEYIILNFIQFQDHDGKSSAITSDTLKKIPQDVRDAMVKAYREVNTPRVVVDKVRRFQDVGRTSATQDDRGELLSASEE